MKPARRIPTLLALALLIVGVGGTVFLVENTTSFFASAAGGQTPQEVTVSNVKDTAFTVSWFTSAPSRSLVKFTKQGLLSSTFTTYDSEDVNKTPTPRTVHSVTVLTAAPQTTYEFEIVSGSKIFKQKDFVVTTSATLAAPTHSLDPAFGLLQQTENVTADSAIVYSSFEGSQKLSSVVKNGNWLIPQGGMRSADGTRYYIPTKDDTQELYFTNGKETSRVTATIETDSPLPTVTLGQNYNFSNKATGRSQLIVAQAESSKTNSGSVTASNTFQITSPQKDAAIAGKKPIFKGTGVAKKFVILTISGNNIAPLTKKITIGDNTNWDWTVETPLEPGKYSFTAVSFTATNKSLVLQQSFTILKSGTQVLGDATPSASLAPTPSPSIVPSLTPSPSPSPAATASPEPVPVTGTTEITGMLLLAAVALISFGAFGYRMK